MSTLLKRKFAYYIIWQILNTIFSFIFLTSKTIYIPPKVPSINIKQLKILKKYIDLFVKHFYFKMWNSLNRRVHRTRATKLWQLNAYEPRNLSLAQIEASITSINKEEEPTISCSMMQSCCPRGAGYCRICTLFYEILDSSGVSLPSSMKNRSLTYDEQHIQINIQRYHFQHISINQSIRASKSN